VSSGSAARRTAVPLQLLIAAMAVSLGRTDSARPAYFWSILLAALLKIRLATR
jgi:hypothetical protein